MDLFLEDVPGYDKEDISWNTSKSYLQAVIPVKEGVVSNIYFLQKSNNSVFVLSCWGDAFDKMLESVDDEDDFEAISDTWPTLGKLLYNGIHDKYSEGALIKLEDPDFDENRWFVASVIGNISFESAEEFFCKKTESGMSIVIEKSMLLFQELQNNEPDNMKAMWRGVKKGFAGAAALTLLTLLGGS